jgi:hypothetical protein
MTIKMITVPQCIKTQNVHQKTKKSWLLAKNDFISINICSVTSFLSTPRDHRHSPLDPEGRIHEAGNVWPQLSQRRTPL